MSINSNDNISKIAKLTTRELPHLAKTAKITVRENNGVYSSPLLGALFEFYLTTDFHRYNLHTQYLVDALPWRIWGNLQKGHSTFKGIV